MVGAHGVGKTTLVKSLENDLPDYEFVFSLSRGILIDSKVSESIQEKILDESYKRYITLLYRKNLLQDRGILDNYVYAYFMYKRGDIRRSLLEKSFRLLCESLPNYDYFLYLPREIPLEADHFRSGDIEYQKAIDDIFIRMSVFVPLLVVSGTLNQRMTYVSRLLRGEAVEFDYL